MNKIFNRIVTAFRSLFVKRILFIEMHYDKKRDQDQVTLWTTEQDLMVQANALRQLADSLEHDAQVEAHKKSLTFTSQN